MIKSLKMITVLDMQFEPQFLMMTQRN
ncbi:hypothetical protein EMIT053CA3_60124 [Pseudomonas donghuensis]